MTGALYKTALIGLGKIGAQYAQDPQIAQFYKYSSHLQVLEDHADYECGAMFDLNDSLAQNNFSSLEDVAKNYKPDILVLATPPLGRIEILQKFEGLQAVVLEKPVAMSLQEAKDIIQYCEDRNIAMQVNYWRRFDAVINVLKDSFQCNNEVPQAIFLTYGNGARNNAVHLIDQVRYMFGEVKDVHSLSAPQKDTDFTMYGDCNVDFHLKLENGSSVFASALDFNEYREIGLDIWTDQRRIEFLQGGLVARISNKSKHRALVGSYEISCDKPEIIQTGAGTAFYNLYDNLSLSLKGKLKLMSSGQSALKNEEILEQLLS